MQLEKENFILKKNAKASTGKLSSLSSSKVYNGPINYSISLLNQHRNKSLSVVKHIRCDVPEFRSTDVVVDTNILGSGVFGNVYSGFITSMRQKVAIKIFHEEANKTEHLAEAKAYRTMCGHPNFVYIFGRVGIGKLLLEFVGDEVTAPSLKDVLKKKQDFPHWEHVCLELVGALHAFHLILKDYYKMI